MEGAESIAVGAMGSVIPKLGALLKEEHKLTKEARGKIMLLIKDLEGLQLFLRRMFEVEDPDIPMKLMARDIRELSYDLEDSVDEFLIRAEKGELGLNPRGLKRMINKITRAQRQHGIASQIHQLQARVNEVSERRNRYMIDEAVSTASSSEAVSMPMVVVDPRLYTDASSTLVGLDCPREEITKLLMEEDESESALQLCVACIVGMGGIGKTTLANQVYQTMASEFDCRAWVAVSHHPNIKRILRDILGQIQQVNLNEYRDTMDERLLIDAIRSALQDKRYLLVVDDIWSVSTWEIIKCALPLNSLGCRIITTTRIIDVAKSCCSHRNSFIYSVKSLSVMDSRVLFYRRIFGSESCCPSDLVEVSDRILRKCSGLPLAITIISSLLASKPCLREEWMKVLYSIDDTLERSGYEGTRRIIFLCYHDLPIHLKTCLLYLGIFPEDYVIDHDSIVRRWIAEGFIPGMQGKTAEEVGGSYFNELINRGMIQPICDSYDGKPGSCRIHDLILDLIISKSVEENFITLLGYESVGPKLSRKVRRLSIKDTNEDKCIPEMMDQSHIRSLSIFGRVGARFSFRNFISLRVLDLEGCKDLNNHDIMKIVGFHQLRYLNIRDTSISILPDQIGLLKFLTLLDLRNTQLQELPVSIVQLRRLAYLLCDIMIFPEGIEKMEALSCLSEVDISQSKISVVEELGNLSELRKLVIWQYRDMESDNTMRYERLASSLCRLYKLQSLCIHGNYGSVDFLDHVYPPLHELQRFQLNKRCFLRRIPEWFRSLSNLIYVCIDVEEVKNEDLQLLSDLPSLCYLSLSSISITAKELVIRQNAFPSLHEFHLDSAWSNLTFEPEAMPKLEKLVLSFYFLADKTRDFDFSIGRLIRLKKFCATIHAKSADASQINAVESAIRFAADSHPNRPIVDVITLPEHGGDEKLEENVEDETMTVDK